MTARWADGHVERVDVELVGTSSTPDASVFGPAPTERLSRVQPLDLGNQVVGSRHRFALGAPINLTDTPAVAAARFEGDSDVTAQWGRPGQVIDLSPGATPEPITLTYAPKAAAKHRGVVSIVAHWPDHSREMQRVLITGSSRNIDDAVDPIPNRSVATHEEQSVRAHDEQRTHRAAAHQQQLGALMRSVFAFQRTGVEIVEKEQEQYKAPAVPRPLWMDLVELAVSMGTGAVASLLERAVLARLAGSMGIGVTRGPSKTVADTETPATAPQPGSAQQGGGGTPKTPTEQTVAQVFSGMKTAAGLATKAQLSSSASPEKSGETNALSANHRINFFAEQTLSLETAQAVLALVNEERGDALTMLDESHPGAAAKLVDEVQQVVTDRNAIVREQMRHTTAQWFAYVTRQALGSESVGSGEGARTATKLARAGRFDKLTPPSKTRGLLDVYIEVKDGAFIVNGASVTGISTLVANRIVDVDLRAAHVPIRVVVNGGSAYITRDEVGRVRYSGFVHLDPDSVPGLPETQQLRTATRIVDAILAKSLTGWGIKHVRTDDTSGADQ